jgi:hypothetical protein
MRSLRCGSDGSFKTRAEVSDRLLRVGQHAAVDQYCQTRMRIDASQGRSAESTGLNYFFVCAQPRIGDGAQPGIGGCHPSTLDLFKQLDERVGLADGLDRMVQGLIA